MVPVLVLCTNPACRASYSLSEADLRDERCRSCGHPLEVPRDSASRPSTSSSSGRSAPASGSPRLDDGSSFGRYRIVRCLGQGGMGSVYLAHDTQLERPVALKIPRLAERDGPEAIERFRREALAAAALDHPNLCPVYDVGEVDGSPYLTMAYIEGRPLSDLVDRPEPVTPRQAAAIVRKLALALQEAHDRGVVHRDLKPSNVLIARRRELVVVDFGLARREGAGDARLTRSGMILGTPTYMAPEQVAGDVDAVGPRSDIYALGVILYELLTGRVPFDGPVTLVLAQVMVAQPEPPSRLRAEVGPDLEAICLRALAKRPEGRFATMAEFAAALNGCVRGPAAGTNPVGGPIAEALAGPPQAAPAPPGPTRGESLLASLFEGLASRTSAAATSVPATEPAVATTPPPPRRRRPLAAAAGGAVAALAIVLGIVIYVRTGEGTVRIEVSDPKADVQVKVDGDAISVEGLGEPLKLRVGGHLLEVEGKDFASRSESFTIKRGDNPAIRLTLVPKPKAPEPPAGSGDGPRPSEGAAAGPKPSAGTVDYLERIGVAQRLIDEGKAHEARAALAACRPEDRNWEWRYLSALIATPADAEGGAEAERSVRPARFLAFDNPGRAGIVTFSPDGREAAVGGNDEKWTFAPLNFYDASTGRLRSSIPDVWGGFPAYSPDGTLVAAIGSNTIKVWKAATHELVADLRGEGSEKYLFTQLAVSPDGRLVAAGDQAKFGVRVWSVGDGKLLHSWADHSNKCWLVAFTPDGRRLVSYGADGMVRVREVRTGNESGSFRVGDVSQQTFGGLSADARRVAAIADSHISIWDVATGEALVTLAGLRARSASFSPDGSRLVTGGQDGQIKIWDTRTGKLALTLRDQGPVTWTSAACFSPDGRRLAAWAGGGEYITTVRIYDAGRPFLAAPPEAHGAATGPRPAEARDRSSQAATSAKVPSPDPATTRNTKLRVGVPDRLRDYRDQLAKAMDAGRARSWDLMVNLLDECPDDLRGWEWGYLRRMAHRSIRIATTGSQKGVRPDEPPRPALTLNLPGVVSFVAFSPSGTRLALAHSWDGKVLVSDVRSGKEVVNLFGHTKQVWGIAFSPDGTRLATGSSDRSVRLWDAGSGRLLRIMEGHSDGVEPVAFSLDGRYLASGGNDGVVRIWEAATGREARALSEPTGGVHGVRYSHDGRQLVCISTDEKGTVNVFDAESGQSRKTFRAQPWPGRMDISPDGRNIVTSSWGEPRLVVSDLATGQARRTIGGPDTKVHLVRYSPDGRWFVSSDGDGNLRFWESSTGREVHTVHAHADAIWGLDFSRDGLRLASGSYDRSVKVWNLLVGSPECRTLRGHKSRVHMAIFSTDGSHVASSSVDGTVRIWNLDSGAPPRILKGNGVQLYSVAYDPDGKSIAAVAHDGLAHIWSVATGDLIRTINAGPEAAYGVSYSRDGKRLTTSGVAGFQTWEVATGRKLMDQGPPGPKVPGVATDAVLASTRDGRRAATRGSDGTVVIKDVQTGATIAKLVGHTQLLGSATYSPDGRRIVTWGWNPPDRWDPIPPGTFDVPGDMRIWDAESGQEILKVVGESGVIFHASFSPDGQKLAVANAGQTVDILDATWPAPSEGPR
ncbi:Serine/threonine-protein kinase PknB [Aquisphaera giovannonii]|uniref:non-specific serine/threonine protein kinase n=1 Tax=Aquisphaera giovannonii TaxID=406548 RepID=A0A5B9VWH4_9BACT|nr:protein kinase [Aquisphaera giovannonii]QEH32060.1 Serine/threonine-protein kinase PknB [Aquisphaera giovannonii]